MRNTPYSFSKPQTNAPAPVQQTNPPAPKTESGFVDLFNRVKKTEAPVQQEPQQQASTEQTTTTTETTQAAQPSSSTTFEDGFNGFKETAGKKVSDFVENPEDFAKIIVRFGNTGRCILLPNLYERAMFTQPEKDALQGILVKSYANEKKKVEPDTDFDNFEKRVYGKWKKLETAKENISYSEEEIVWLAKIVAKRIKDMTVAVWMEKYDWLLALLYLEFKHAQTILAVKAEDFITSRFMGKAA